MAQKEENREDEQALPPEETEDEAAAAEVEEDEEDEEESEEEAESEQDIDFEKELEALEGEVAPEEESPPKKKTEEEKAGYHVRETIKRLKKQGKTDAEISKIVGYKVVTEESEEDDEEESTQDTDRKYVTKEDLDIREAEKEAEKLSRSAAEKKVIMWYVRNKKLSVADAHLLANKGRIKRNGEEIERARESRPGAAGAAGRRETVDRKPRFSKAEMETMTRRGMSWNPQTKQMEGKYTFVKLDEKTGERVTGRLEPKKK